MMTSNKEKWLAELSVIGAQLVDAAVELRKAHDYRDHTYGETYDARRRNAMKMRTRIKKLDTKRKYREKKLKELEGPPVHHDIFGQEFKVGCRVAWSSSARYAGAQLGTVTGVSQQMVLVSQLRSWRPEQGTHIWPKNLIVVDKLIGDPEAKGRAEDSGQYSGMGCG